MIKVNPNNGNETGKIIHFPLEYIQIRRQRLFLSKNIKVFQ